MTQQSRNQGSDQIDLIQQQYEREEQMYVLDIEGFRKQLEQGKRNIDLSRGKAGKATDKYHLKEINDAINADLKHTFVRRHAPATDDCRAVCHGMGLPLWPRPVTQ